jgi:nitrate/TMAO reductase-like tetraheme cytochrome c subunit
MLSILALFGVSGAVLMAGCRLVQTGVKDTTPRGCAECHVDIARQWETSAHAIAWTNPEFGSETRMQTTKECLPCHAPEPVLEKSVNAPVALREERREDGVDCVTCHRLGDAYAGPYKGWGPHEMTQTAWMTCSHFCGTCHSYEIREYETLYLPVARSRGEVKQCAECHMPARRARLTQGHILSLAHPKRVVRDHSFPAWTEEVIRGAIEVTDAPTFAREDREYTVKFTLTNRGAGHRIPPGGHGHEEVRIVIELIDQAGNVVGAKEHSLFGSRAMGLAPERPTPFSFRVEITEGSNPVRTRLLIESVKRDRSVRRPLLDRQWELSST